ncbi:flagellar biosynthesis protein FlgL [Vogesella sp. LIG4]|uniref:flagellin N-terminal helical domain-containing protein n=1 Tax=Vogesella sp. LIG4 TaxID=1192162 RepID=UPI0008201B55|nr:flagellar biosynthesis protein FlgL [Vogesella sp. LIG4]SCK17663.1 flagellar hook-associated protein 3 FlgL [Vogesella sp. LIG4]
MRIASTQYSATMNQALQLASSGMADLMQQMATGQRILRPSDEPVTSVRLARLEREDAALSQYRDNISALKTRLTKNEALMDGMVKDMQQARDQLVWASDSGGNSNADVAAMASTLVALRDSLYYSTNSRDDEGHYLFSGTASNQPAATFNAVAPAGSRYAFGGNTNAQLVMVGNGVTQAANVSLDEMATLLNQLDSTIATLQSPALNISNPATQANITASLNLVDSTMNSVSAKIALQGGAQNTLQTLDGNHANVSLSNQQAALSLGQLDYGKASVELNGYTTAVQATQKVYGRVSQLSLFNAL